MKPYYIATGFRRIEAQREVHRLLGPGLTYDWTLEPPADNLTVKRRHEIAKAELEGVAEAKVLVVLLPGGRGTHVELGAALPDVLCYPAKKQIVLHSLTGDEFEPVSCIFHWVDAVHRIVGSFEELAKFVKEKL